jgi:hypothetical protein
MHAIGGDGEYCGDSDAQLGRINPRWQVRTGKACSEETHSLRNRVLGAKRREKNLRN